MPRVYHGQHERFSKFAAEKLGLSVFYATAAERIEEDLMFRDFPVDHVHAAGIDEHFEELSLSYEDLRTSTNDFSDDNLLQDNGGEKIYTGLLPDFPFVITVKVYSDIVYGKEEFQTELRAVRLCRHRNVVRLLGAKACKDKHLLVLEGTPNGTLDDLLYAVRTQEISWDTRMRVALDVATGLSYLHEDLGISIQLVHRNLNPSTIFFSGSTAKIGGLGVSRLAMGNDQNNRSVQLKGIYGYMSPEIIRDGVISTAGDVYSFGVIILEIIMRRRPHRRDFERIQKSCSTPHYALNHIVCRTLVPELASSRQKEAALRLLIDLGLRCVVDDPLSRPTMKEVVAELKSITSETGSESEQNCLSPAPKELCTRSTETPNGLEHGTEQSTDEMDYRVQISSDDLQFSHGFLKYVRKQYEKVVSRFLPRRAFHFLGTGHHDRLEMDLDPERYREYLENLVRINPVSMDSWIGIELQQEQLASLVRREGKQQGHQRPH